MARPKTQKSAPAHDALLSVLTEPAVAVADTDQTRDAAEPASAVRDEEQASLDLRATPAEPGDLIKALIETLGHEMEDVASVDIRRPGIVRVLGRDRGLRSHRFEWPKPEVAE